MKTIAAAALALLATSVSAATYQDFPAGGLSCPTSSGDKLTPLADLKKAADGVKGTTPRETSASNLASGKCTSLDQPLYDTSIGESTIGVAYDEAKDTFYFCYAQAGGDYDGDGWPDGCTEQ